MAKILVVDDAMLARRNLISVLTYIGHKIVGEASHGEEAIKKYEALKPDLVTMDITMPGLDGVGTVKQIMSKYPDAKIVMVSAITQKATVYEALKSGAKHYILKPFTPQKVVEVINKCLEMK